MDEGLEFDGIVLAEGVLMPLFGGFYSYWLSNEPLGRVIVIDTTNTIIWHTCKKGTRCVAHFL
jgi:hypothetical protein